MDIGFSELVIEGDRVEVMNAINSSKANLSRLVHVFEDVGAHLESKEGRSTLGEEECKFGCP